MYERAAGMRNVALDGVRGIAIALVIFYHAFANLAATPQPGAPLAWAGKSAWVGVDLFFVLSGYLITGILLQTRDRPGYFRIFYMRRFFRIFPLYYSYLLFLFLVARFHVKWQAIHLSWHFFYLSNLGMAFHDAGGLVSHLWSLSVEEQFYLVWPALILLVPRRHTIATIAVLFCVLAATRQYFGLVSANNYVVYGILHFDGLLLGSALAVWIRSSPNPPQAVRAARAALAVMLISGGILFAEMLHNHGLIWWSWHGVQYLNYSLIAAAGTAFVAMTLYSGAKSPINQALKSRPLVALGKYSYAIYLVQIPLDAEFRNFHLSPSGVTGAILYTILLGGASFLCALATWTLLERPCLALKERWFAYQPAAPPTPVAAFKVTA